MNIRKQNNNYYLVIELEEVCKDFNDLVKNNSEKAESAFKDVFTSAGFDVNDVKWWIATKDCCETLCAELHIDCRDVIFECARMEGSFKQCFQCWAKYVESLAKEDEKTNDEPEVPEIVAMIGKKIDELLEGYKGPKPLIFIAMLNTEEV